jgi:hypothetical protein
MCAGPRRCVVDRFIGGEFSGYEKHRLRWRKLLLDAESG